MLLNPSKERTPKLVRAGWSGNFDALILGTQSLLASQGAPSPVHPALVLGTPELVRVLVLQESSICAMETSPRPDPAAPDTWKQPQTPGSSPAPGQEPGESEAQGMPPIPTTAARGRQQRSTGAAAAALAGEEILASTSKARELRWD